MADTPPTDRGTPFGPYRLIELLGRGGMGDVWRAYDTATDRVVALKVLPAHLADDAVFKERFRREAHAAAGLSEPHIVPIHTYGEIDGRLFVDMRLIRGRDLQTVLAERPLPLARALLITDQVAQALHAAHEVGLVHRDVKPSNILITDTDFAYLIDFGIARAAGETGLTATGGLIGTYRYMAPERFNTGQADARSDIYALACVLYEALTGSPPFPGDSPEQQLAGHLATPPPRPSSSNPGVPAGFDAVIAKGMAKDPDQRYATTVELASAAHDATTAPIPRPAASVPAPPPAAPASAFNAPPTIFDTVGTQPPPVQAPNQWQRPSVARRPATPPQPVPLPIAAYQGHDVAPTAHGIWQQPAPPASAPREKPPSRHPVRPAEPARPRRSSARIAIGVVLLVSGAILTVLALEASTLYVCSNWYYDQSGTHCRESQEQGVWVFLQPYVQAALVPPLWTAGILVLRRYLWWTYALVPIAGIVTWLLYRPSHTGEGYPFYPFVFFVFLTTAICVLIAWGITRFAAAGRGRARAVNR
jgi:serine/threonine protein kinase